jgi:hypothetical protein
MNVGKRRLAAVVALSMFGSLAYGGPMERVPDLHIDLGPSTTPQFDTNLTSGTNLISGGGNYGSSGGGGYGSSGGGGFSSGSGGYSSGGDYSSSDGGGGGGPPTFRRVPVIAYCVFSENDSADCTDMSTADAARSLAEDYLEAFAQAGVERSVGFYIPGFYSKAEQLRALLNVQNAAIRIVQAKLRADLAELQPWHWWDSPEERARKEAMARQDGARVINAWAARERGSGWSHDWSGSHKLEIHTGPAYESLKEIHSRGSWF